MVYDIDDIICSKLSGEALNPEENQLFEIWYNEAEHQKQYTELQHLQALIQAGHVHQKASREQAWQRFRRQITPSLSFRQLMPYAALAIILLSIGIAFYFLNRPENRLPEMTQNDPQKQIDKKQIILTLSNGQQLPLGDTLLANLKHEQGVVINNNTPHTLIYNVEGETSTPGNNTMTIPRGGEYLLILADGTKVWLNSESEITYPVVFAGKTRELTLRGEAYFEVAKNSAQPFIVHTSEFDVRVTGTQFNVRTYNDDYPSATLVEGKVQIEQAGKINFLQPGQQSRLIEGEIATRLVDLEEVTAWRQEAFCFKERRLENILNELSRWYDFHILYQQTEIKDYHFTAWFHRSTPLQEMITILEKTHKIKINLNGKNLTVQNSN